MPPGYGLDGGKKRPVYEGTLVRCSGRLSHVCLCGSSLLPWSLSWRQLPWRCPWLLTLCQWTHAAGDERAGGERARSYTPGASLPVHCGWSTASFFRSHCLSQGAPPRAAAPSGFCSLQAEPQLLSTEPFLNSPQLPHESFTPACCRDPTFSRGDPGSGCLVCAQGTTGHPNASLPWVMFRVKATRIENQVVSCGGVWRY